MAAKNPQKVATKWVNNTANNRDSYAEGVNAVQINPAAQAAAKADFWQQQVSSPEARDKFRSKLGQVTLEAWKNAVNRKGVANYQTGVRAGQEKFFAFLNAFLPYVQQGRTQLPPRGTFEDNLRRSEAMARWNKQFRLGGGLAGQTLPFLGTMT